MMPDDNISKLGIKSLLKLFSGTFLVNVSYTILGFINTILLVKVLGSSHYGTYIFCLSIVSLLSIPIQFGVPTMVMREFAAYQMIKRWDLIKGLEISSHVFVLIMSFLIGGMAIIFITMNAEQYYEDKYNSLLISVALVPILSFGALRDSMLKGFRYVVLGLLSECIIRPLFLLICLVAVIGFGIEINNSSILIKVYIICSIISFIIGIYIYSLKRPIILNSEVPTYKNKEWILVALPLGFTTGIQALGLQLSTVSLDYFGESSDIAFYRVAVLISGFVVVILQVINSVVAPHFSRLYASGDLKSIETLIAKTMKIVFATTIPIVIGIIVFGEWILQFFYGIEFAASFYPLVILTLSQGVNALFGMVGLLLNMTGFQKSVTKLVFFTFIINVFLHFLLVPKYGATGAAISSFISMFFLNFLCWLLVKFNLKIKYFI